MTQVRAIQARAAGLRRRLPGGGVYPAAQLVAVVPVGPWGRVSVVVVLAAAGRVVVVVGAGTCSVTVVPGGDVVLVVGPAGAVP